jgi:hypothetical protein
MIHCSSLCKRLTCCALLCGACNRTHHLSFETAHLGSESPRRAPAVAVDPAPALPPMQRHATADRGLLVLEAPASERADESFVRRFFEAVKERNSDKLESLFHSGAKAKTSATATEMDAVDFWKSRLSRLDYSKLAEQSIYRRHAVEIYTEQDLKQLSTERQLPVEVVGEQVAVRVPLLSPETDKNRLFGDEIVFLLVPSERGLRIVEMVEDFQLP